MMKKIFWTIIGVLTMLSASCASTDGKGDEPVYEGDGVSLAEAIERSAENIAAEKIAADMLTGRRVAIVAWESPSPGLSDYIMEELTGALVDWGMEVADRQNLAYVYRELNLQMSGEVSDESARAIGKFLGADLVITGQFTELGGPYRYRASVVNVESATRDSVTRLSVRGDAEMRRMIAALANQKAAAKTASYGGSGTPGTAGAFLDRGITLAIQGEFESAIADFTEAIRLNPEFSAAYLLRGRSLHTSVSDVQSVGENFSSVMTTIRTSGVITSSQQQAYDKAIEDYTQAIRLDPNSSIAYRERGKAYSDKGDQDKAIADYTQAIRLDPNYALAYNGRGAAYNNKRDYDRAIADYTQAIRLNPNFIYAYDNRGNAYSNKEDYDRAIADYTQAIRLDPNFALAYNNRGNAYFNKKDYDRAITDYTQVIRLDPSYVYAYGNRGSAYNNKGDYDRAIADYTQAIRLDPNAVSAYNNRGNAYYNKKDYDRAITDYTQAISLDPNDADAYGIRGVAYSRSGQNSRAIQDLEKAIALNPNDQWAKDRLGEIQGR
jgi:tetratricopeptide (TPR) repeat protein